MKKSNSQNKKSTKIIKEAEKVKKKSKLSNSERAKLDEMNQIEWFPIDPYCD